MTTATENTEEADLSICADVWEGDYPGRDDSVPSAEAAAALAHDQVRFILEDHATGGDSSRSYQGLSETAARFIRDYLEGDAGVPISEGEQEELEEIAGLLDRCAELCAAVPPEAAEKMEEAHRRLDSILEGSGGD